MFVTEADEASKTLKEALVRFGEMAVQYRGGRETLGVVGMYELAAISKGATVQQIDEVWKRSAYLLTLCRWRLL